MNACAKTLRLANCISVSTPRTTADIWERYNSQAIHENEKAQRNNFQRRLLDLEDALPFVLIKNAGDRGHPTTWYYKKPTTIPQANNTEQALRQAGTNNLPLAQDQNQTSNTSAENEEAAEHVLKIPRYPLAAPPPYERDILDMLLDAIKRGFQLEIDYSQNDINQAHIATDQRKPNWIGLHLNPLALVQYGDYWYLFASSKSGKRFDHYRLDRISNSHLIQDRIINFWEMTEDQLQELRPVSQKIACSIRSLSLEDTVRRSFQQKIPSINCDSMSLHLKFKGNAAFHLAEQPLSNDQRIERKNGGTHIYATVQNSTALLDYILTLGSSVEVLGPLALRTHLANHYEAMATQYGNHSA